MNSLVSLTLIESLHLSKYSASAVPRGLFYDLPKMTHKTCLVVYIKTYSGTYLTKKNNNNYSLSQQTPVHFAGSHILEL